MDDRFELMMEETVQEIQDRRAAEAKKRKEDLQKVEKRGRCEGWEGPCEHTQDLSWYTPRTAYHWDIDKDPQCDPNRARFLCEECAQGMEEYWNDRWGDYYSGCL